MKANRRAGITQTQISRIRSLRGEGKIDDLEWEALGDISSLTKKRARVVIEAAEGRVKVSNLSDEERTRQQSRVRSAPPPKKKKPKLSAYEKNKLSLLGGETYKPPKPKSHQRQLIDRVAENTRTNRSHK